MIYTIKYGIVNSNIDVTQICLDILCKNDTIHIPSNDYRRTVYFTDNNPGFTKSIFIYNNNNMIGVYDHTMDIYINTIKNNISTRQNNLYRLPTNNDPSAKLDNIHKKLRITYGDIDDELPEQLMVAKYFNGTEKVLELGGNIGRNSLVIASLVDNTNFVTLECDYETSQQLEYNRNLNNFSFFIEPSALSKRKLIQQGWQTIESDIILEGYKQVNTITWEELNNKYNIEFDTLVLDCEGAFYNIVIDMPEILKNIKTIIMENDYTDIMKKIKVDDVLLSNNFNVAHVEAGGWGPCYFNFFEVWKKCV